ncbi:hypothetical protein BDR04DRAFT_1113524 [Suillus decipiens]|nr:hypothetical protein BDR04DRAFT_1113524 [Suillus decipiens]
MTQDDWRTMLEGHSIFTLPSGYGGQSEESLELSTNTLKKSILNEGPLDGIPRSGRRRVMVLKESDLIVAAGYELRITSLLASKLGRSTNNSFKLIAVAGAHQVAVVVLPRVGYSKLVSSSVDCKSIQVGSFYHHLHLSAPIAKIEWHPWGEAGSTLMVMTVDGKLRCSNPIITGTEDFLAPIEGPSAYVSLLGTEPFVPPLALSRPSGSPSNPRFAVGTPDTKTEFVLTPETLRNLGSTIEGLTSQIHEIILAYKATEVRAELQAKEFERQQQKCSSMLDLIEQLGGLRNSEVKGRLERIREVYRALASRLDHRLQTLMQQASPKLSEYETKWFEELRRMKAEIAGAGSLNDMAAKDAERKKHLCESGLGLSQAFQFGERTNQERTKIAELEETIIKMASKLELSLARPPSLRETPQN